MAQVITTYKPNFIPISITGTDVGVFHKLTIPTVVPQSGAVDLIVTGAGGGGGGPLTSLALLGPNAGSTGPATINNAMILLPGAYLVLSFKNNIWYAFTTTGDSLNFTFNF
jgi:hypothetical protein